MSQVYYNGEWLEESEVKLSLYDRSFLYGIGLFETLKVSQGRVLFLEQHLDRLIQSASLLHLVVPLSVENLKIQIAELLKRHSLNSAILRIYLTEKSASIGPLEVASSHSNLLMTLSPFQDYPISYYQEGVPVQISKKYFADSGLLSSVKSTNYLKFVLAKREAHQNHVFETLLLNPFGLLCEASSSNIFYVKEGVLKTPPLQDGVLPGVLRKQVIELSEREGIPFQEESLQVAHLSQIDEMFLTSSLKEIMPVREIQEVKKFDQVPGELTRRVMKNFLSF